MAHETPAEIAGPNPPPGSAERKSGGFPFWGRISPNFSWPHESRAPLSSTEELWRVQGRLLVEQELLMRY